MGWELRRRGYRVGWLKVRKLMRLLWVEAIYPRKRLSIPAKDHQIYPYLLRELEIDRPNKVWAADITYIRLKRGFVYLVAVMDVFSRYIISWWLANTLEPGFCREALKEALECDHPEYFNTDRGAQFTSSELLSILQGEEIKINLDGKGRVIDNIFIERFWWTLKYEEVYTKCYETVAECRASIGEFIHKYNEERLHQSLGVYDTPFEAYYQLPVSAAC